MINLYEIYKYSSDPTDLPDNVLALCDAHAAHTGTTCNVYPLNETATHCDFCRHSD